VTITSSQTGAFTSAPFLLLRRSRFVQSVAGFLLECVAGFVGIRNHRQPERQERRKGGLTIDPPGFDAGKKIKGKKRHVLVDTQGLLLHAVVHAANIQDRDGGVLLMSTLFGAFPFLLKL
jgi:hypothetical protein